MWRTLRRAMVAAKDKDPRIGVRVVAKYRALLRDGAQVVDEGNDYKVYRVERAKHIWLWLVPETGGKSGWARCTDVVPFDGAIDFYTDEIRSQPGNAMTHLWRGIIRDEKGEHDKAIADFNEAIRLDPKKASLYGNRGVAWSHKGEYDKAIADYNEAIRLDPKSTSYHVDRGVSWRQKGEYDKAIADFTEAIRLNPQHAWAHYCRGFTLANKGEHGWAILDFTEAIRLQPTHASAYHARGIAWENKGERDIAIADYTKAIRLDPAHAWAYYNRGDIWEWKEEYDKAIADYSEAIRLDPTHAWAYNDRAWLWATCPDERCRDVKQAVLSALQASKLTDGKNAKVAFTLAVVYYESGDRIKASKWQQKAHDLCKNKEYAEQHYSLGDYIEKSKMRSKMRLAPGDLAKLRELHKRLSRTDNAS